MTEVDNFLLLNTTAGTINMTCSVPPDTTLNELDQFHWQWLRLDPAPGNAIRNHITESVTRGTKINIYFKNRAAFAIEKHFVSERDLSVYTHPVQCTSTGFYQAFYRNESGACLFSCYFVISEVRETRLSALREDFAAYCEYRSIAAVHGHH